MFKGGSSIRPASPDFSGFSNAAQVEAESMARLGASISGAVKNYQAKKEQKEANESYDRMMEGFANSDTKMGRALKSMGLVDAESIKASRKGLGKKELLTLVNMFATLEAKSSTPTQGIKDLQAFKENLPDDLKITPDGRIVDVTFKNEILSRNNPRVRQLLQTEEGKYFLSGYKDAELLSQTPSGNSSEENVIDLGTITR